MMATTQISLLDLAPLSNDLLVAHGWQTFTDDHDIDDAQARYLRRYGQQPQHIGFDERWLPRTLKLGPVPGEEMKR